MISNLSPELGAELLDDFYAECDEHLTAIRQALVSLEGSIGRAQSDPSTVEKLFRSFHSLKGNSAIIGLRPAEELAHAAEGFLRSLSRGNVTLTSEGLDLLMNATQRLEQVVATHRAGQPLPEIGHLVEQLGKLSGAPASPESSETEMPSIAGSESLEDASNSMEEARAHGLGLWKFTFSPSRELDSRGVHVNSVRARIGEAGKILQATPHVGADGSVVFEFVAALRETPANISGWEEDGIAIGPFEPPAKAASISSDPETTHGPFVAPSHIVRVDLSRLDELMRLTGELVIHRARLDDQLSRALARNSDMDLRSLQETNVALGRTLRELRENITRVRLVPVAEIFARMPFVVRDLARETGKKVRLTLSGQNTEIDKYLVERLKDPLLHLVRNSVTHGIERAEERTARGKPAQATIFLRASTMGDTVLIEVGDDGRGIDLPAVTRRAAELGLPSPAGSDSALLNILCAAGFSTRDEADRGAGRGVGMGVVQNTVRELGGTLSLETKQDRGTKFSLRLPLTLAIADVFILSAHEQTCAVPQSFVQEVLQMTNAQVRRINNIEVIPYRDGILPLIRLRAMFGVGESAQATLPVLVLSTERGSTGLVVDHIRGQREVVVRAIRDPLLQVPGIAGATELGDGRPVLILDAAGLTSGIVRPPAKENSSSVDMNLQEIAI